MAGKRFLAVTAAIGVMLGAAGCTNSDVLESSGSTLRVNVVIANSATRFDEAFFFIRQIFVEPTDPLPASASNEPLALINPRDVIEINANQEGFQFDIPVNLGTGPWRVTSIRLDGFFYEDFDPPASEATCDEYVARWAPTEAVADLTALGSDAVFNIVPDTINQFTITIDHALFLAAFQDSFLCFPRGVLGCGDAWCLYPDPSDPLFNPAALFLLAPQYLSFE